MQQSLQKPANQQRPLSPLRRYYQANGKFTANQLISISMKDRYIYFKVPKVASTTLSASLTSMEIRDFPAVTVPPHSGVTGSVFIRPFQLPMQEANRIMLSPEYKRVVFARHPFSRVLSAYRHRVADPDTNQTKSHVLKHLRGENADIHEIIDFDTFLDLLPELEPRRMEAHYRPQATLAGADFFKHDFIGKLETIDDDIKRLEGFLGLPLTDFYKVKQQHKTGAGESWREEMTSPRKRIVERVYAADYEAFGY